MGMLSSTPPPQSGEKRLDIGMQKDPLVELAENRPNDPVIPYTKFSSQRQVSH